MAFDFPASPTVGQTFQNYTWDGEKWITATPVTAALTTPKKNYILNGAMMVSQENGSSSGTGTFRYIADQWFQAISGSSGTISGTRVASVTPAGSPNRLRVEVTVADASVGAGDVVEIEHRIEGLSVADLLFGTASAKATTLKFGVKAPAGTYCVTFVNAANNRSCVAEYTISGGEANTDVYKTITIPGDTSGTWLTDTGIGLALRFGLMVGSTYQQAAGSWGTGNVYGSSNQSNFMNTVGNVFELFDVGMYEGTLAPTFVVPDYSSELRLCQRYWEKSYDYGIKPGTVNSNGCVAERSDSATLTFSTKFLAPKRATPTVTSYSTLTGGSGLAENASTGADVASSLIRIGEAGFTAQFTGIVASTLMQFHFTASARL